ncbi:MAG: hypothetical protein MZV64_37550 [Ignavibacteriales bacterium]|nr:hypothetical protein [Ignavibacteriales bacterium]
MTWVNLVLAWEQLEKLGLSESELKIQAELFYRKLEETPYEVKNESNEPNSWNEIIQAMQYQSR